MNSYDIERFKALETQFEASETTKRQLGNKVLVRVLGPSGAGKSTIVHQAIEFQAHQTVATWGEPGSIVTRNRRPDDPPQYRTADEGITREAIAHRIVEGSLTNYSIHPSGEFYATGPESFAYDYNLLPTLPSSLPALDRAGFEKSHTVFIAVEPFDLEAGLEARESDPSFASRLQESVENVEYALEHSDDMYFIQNSHLRGGKEMAADDLIAISLDNYYVDKAPGLTIAHAMHRYLKEYLER